jgi:hypothetical protein
MVELTLPANSKIDKSAGKTFKAPAGAKRVRKFVIYRYDRTRARIRAWTPTKWTWTSAARWSWTR